MSQFSSSSAQSQLQCTLCKWSGGDVSEIVTADGSELICQSCLVAVSTNVEKVGDLHPATLVPLIRSCVAQTVGVILGQFIDYLVQISSVCIEQGMSPADRMAAIQLAVSKLKDSLN